MNNFSIGVDLGGTNLRVAAVADDGKVLKKMALGTELLRGRETVVTAMCESIQSLAKEFQKSSALAGIGIGVPGIIDLDTGMLYHSPNLPGWSNYPVRDEIEKRLRTRVILENDANVAALGEKWIGAAKDVDDMCMITLGTGVGGGIVLDGRLWHGANGFAGEIGHITVVNDGYPCGCGNRGCVEQYSSATAIKRIAGEAIARGDAPQLKKKIDQGTELTSEFVYRMAMQGDEPCKKIFADMGQALGLLIAGLLNTLDLAMVVIGGGAASAWDAFHPAMMAELRQRSYVFRTTSPEALGSSGHSGTPTQITRAVLGDNAGLVGAARLPLQMR